MAAEPKPAVRKGFRILESPNAFGVLVKGVRFGWNTAWQLMMAELAPSSSTGSYVRPDNKISQGHDNIDGENELVLYQGVACGWCHRVMLGRSLYGCKDLIKVVTLTPGDDGLWRLPDTGGRLKDIYLAINPEYRGRFTAPLLVNTTKGEIVSNESADILDLIAPPPASESTNDNTELVAEIQDNVNNGVYKVGFASTQQAYDTAEGELFATLDKLEGILAGQKFLSGNDEDDGYGVADIRLFPTAYRFDGIYSILFKACRKSIRKDYPNISRWLNTMYALPGVKETCDLDATRRHYFGSLFPLNPGGIIPNTPDPFQ